MLILYFLREILFAAHTREFFSALFFTQIHLNHSDVSLWRKVDNNFSGKKLFKSKAKNLDFKMDQAQYLQSSCFLHQNQALIVQKHILLSVFLLVLLHSPLLSVMENHRGLKVHQGNWDLRIPMIVTKTPRFCPQSQTAEWKKRKWNC